MAEWLQFIVRFLHVLFGIAWVGGSLFFGHSVAGGLRKAPPEVQGPATIAVMRKAMTFFLVAGVLTIVFGVWNQLLIAGELDYRSGRWNVLLGASLVTALLMLGIGAFNNLPTFRKLEAMPPPEGPPGEERQALAKRMMIGGLSITLLGVLAVGLMVAAVATRMGVL